MTENKPRFGLNKEILFNTERLINKDLETIGVDKSIVHLKGTKLVEYKDLALPTNHWIEMVNGNVKAGAVMAYEVDFSDGQGRVWDGRAWIFPQSLEINGKNLPLPAIVDQLGYQVLINKNRNPDGLPSVRIESVCLTSMLTDGHIASAGVEGLGCDCDRQRMLAEDMIHKDGGASVLTPFEGRGNGLHVHASQIGMQNFASRHNMLVPDTYTAHQVQGCPPDNRLPFYALDVLVLRAFGIDQVNLLTNNPNKVDALVNNGISVVQLTPLHDNNKRAGYYNGQNFQAKVTNGHKSF